MSPMQLAEQIKSLFWDPLPGIQVPLQGLILAGLAVFATIVLALGQFRGFRHAVDVVRGKFDSPDDPGDLNHFRALCGALSGTVGLGNIAGVAVAVQFGGPPAVVWMVVFGFLAMALKGFEVCLGCHFRRFSQNDGKVLGGPMYYLREVSLVGAPIAAGYALLLAGSALLGSNMFQINQAAVAFEQSFNIPPIVTGIGVAVFTGIVIFGGATSIGRVSGVLIPVMAVGYMLCCLTVIVTNVSELPASLALMIKGAFFGIERFEHFQGAAFGTVLSWGLQRAVFSCEAGLGSAVVMHAAAKTDHPAREGMVAFLEPFIDTIVICALTGLTLTVSGAWHSGEPEIAMTQRALGPFMGTYFLPFAVLLFCVSTIISWAYYGEQAVRYLSGEESGSTSRRLLARRLSFLYRLITIAAVVAGALWSATSILILSDLAMVGMVILNGIGLLYHHRLVRSHFRSYEARYLTPTQTTV